LFKELIVFTPKGQNHPERVKVFFRIQNSPHELKKKIWCYKLLLFQAEEAERLRRLMTGHQIPDTRQDEELAAGKKNLFLLLLQKGFPNQLPRSRKHVTNVELYFMPGAGKHCRKGAGCRPMII
jgi:hypothetical protein